MPPWKSEMITRDCLRGTFMFCMSSPLSIVNECAPRFCWLGSMLICYFWDQCKFYCLILWSCGAWEWFPMFVSVILWGFLPFDLREWRRLSKSKQMSGVISYKEISLYSEKYWSLTRSTAQLFFHLLFFISKDFDAMDEKDLWNQL